VTGLDDDGQSKRVRFSDGSTGTYDLVVGADGVHSTVRSLALGGRPARAVGQASWRFVADGFPEIADWTVMLGRGRVFLTVALGEGSVTATPTSTRVRRQTLAGLSGAGCSST